MNTKQLIVAIQKAAKGARLREKMYEREAHSPEVRKSPDSPRFEGIATGSRWAAEDLEEILAQIT